MVADHPFRAQPAEEAQYAEGVGSAVHEVADGVQFVGRGIELHRLEELLQLLAAPLDVSDEEASFHAGRIPFPSPPSSLASGSSTGSGAVSTASAARP